MKLLTLVLSLLLCAGNGLRAEEPPTKAPYYVVGAIAGGLSYLCFDSARNERKRAERINRIPENRPTGQGFFVSNAEGSRKARRAARLHNTVGAVLAVGSVALIGKGVFLRMDNEGTAYIEKGWKF